MMPLSPRRTPRPHARSWALALLLCGSPAATQEPDPGRIEDLYAHAVAVAEETRRNVPNLSKTLFDLGRVHQAFGYDERAIEVYRQGLQLDPRHPEILSEIGFLLSQRNRMEEALAAYREALRLDPALPNAHRRIGLILAHEGRHKEAVEELRAEIDNRTADASTYNTLGHALLDLQKVPEAARSFREAIRLSPESREGYYGLAQAYRRLGKRQEEAKALAQFVRLKERDDASAAANTSQEANRREFLAKTAAVYLDAAETYLHVKRLDDAERCLRGALRFQPAHEGARRSLTEILRSQGKLQEAIACCREQLARERSAGWLFLLAGLSAQNNDFAEAARLLEEAVSSKQEDAHARRELARLILNGRAAGGVERALELARAARDLAPLEAANYDVLGWALFQKGDVPGARGALETAARLEPGNTAYQKRLLDIQRRKE